MLNNCTQRNTPQLFACYNQQYVVADIACIYINNNNALHYAVNIATDYEINMQCANYFNKKINLLKICISFVYSETLQAANI